MVTTVAGRNAVLGEPLVNECYRLFSKLRACSVDFLIEKFQLGKINEHDDSQRMNCALVGRPSVHKVVVAVRVRSQFQIPGRASPRWVSGMASRLAMQSFAEKPQ